MSPRKTSEGGNSQFPPGDSQDRPDAEIASTTQAGESAESAESLHSWLVRTGLDLRIHRRAIARALADELGVDRDRVEGDPELALIEALWGWRAASHALVKARDESRDRVTSPSAPRWARPRACADLPEVRATTARGGRTMAAGHLGVKAHLLVAAAQLAEGGPPPTEPQDGEGDDLPEPVAAGERAGAVLTSTMITTRDGERAGLVVEWDHPGGRRGFGAPGRHRAVMLRVPDVGERPVISIERVRGYSADGIPSWSTENCAPASFLVGVLLRERARLGRHE